MIRIFLFYGFITLLFCCKNDPLDHKSSELKSNQVVVDLKADVSPRHLEGALKTFKFKAVSCIDTTNNIWIYQYDEKKTDKERLTLYLKKSMHTDHAKDK